MRTLLKHAMIVTMDDKGQVYTDGNLLFEDDRILQAGTAPVDENTCDEVLDLTGKLILPGLVNRMSIRPSSWQEGWRTMWTC